MSSMGDERYQARIKVFSGKIDDWASFKSKFKAHLVLKGLYASLVEGPPQGGDNPGDAG
jgi:hypothetical protein